MEEKLTRKEKKLLTRKQLKDAALKCFFELGFNETQIANIAKTAGVASGTFYVHFNNKEEILDELLSEFNKEFIDTLIGLWKENTSDTLEDLLSEIAVTFLSYWEEKSDFIGLYAQKVASGLKIQNLRDGINPEAFGFFSSAIKYLCLINNLNYSEIELTLHGILALWMRIGLQYLYNENVTMEISKNILVKSTIGILKANIPNIENIFLLFKKGNK